MEFLQAMPSSMIRPIAVNRLNASPETSSATNAPQRASGRASMMVNGVMKDS